MEGSAGETVSVEPDTIVTLADPEALELATEVALTVTVAGEGAEPGAV